MNYINAKQYLSIVLGDEYGTLTATAAEQHFSDSDTPHLIELVFSKHKILANYASESDSATATTYHFTVSPLCNPDRLYIRKACEELSLRIGTPCESVPTDDGTIAVRVIKSDRQTVYWTSYVDTMLQDANDGHFFAGVDENGNPIMLDFDECVHILIGGTTGSGKSVLLKSLICGMATKPHLYNLAFIDLKGTELTQFDALASLPVATDPEAACAVVRRVREQMDERYAMLRQKDKFLEMYRNCFEQDLPKVILVVDEYAELKMMCPEIETDLIHIAQKGRAAGIHLIIATQRPEYKILSGLLKENLPTKIALHTANSVSSKVLLDTPGAERLIGNGDALLKLPSGVNLTHFQAPFIPDRGEMCLSEIVGNLKSIKDATTRKFTVLGKNYNNLLTLWYEQAQKPDPLRALDVDETAETTSASANSTETSTAKPSFWKRALNWWNGLKGWQQFLLFFSALFAVGCVLGMIGVTGK